jgi:hypothetical protein
MRPGARVGKQTRRLCGSGVGTRNRSAISRAPAAPEAGPAIFGFYNVAGILVSTVSAVELAAIALRRAGALPELSESHLHDLGKLMFAFSTFWAYQ